MVQQPASGTKGIPALPKYLDLTSKLTQTEEIARAKREQYQLYYGTLQPGKPVAIKRLRSSLNDNEILRKAFLRELKRWSSLRHQNILHILGCTVDEGGVPAIITEWMAHGSALDYVKKIHQADVFKMVQGIAEGLAYLHEENVVHGDIRSDHVVVSNVGVPLVADFGIARLLVVTHTIRDVNELMRGVRWMAIELVKPRTNSKDHTSSGTNIVEQTKESDVWAFGMVIYELLTKAYPFSGLPDVQVLIRLVGGGLPHPPTDIRSRPSVDQSMWDLCKRCWNKDPASRPAMSSIVTDMRNESFQMPSLRSETRDGTGSTDAPVHPDRPRTRSLPSGITSSIAAIMNSPSETVPPVPRLSAAIHAHNGRIAQPRHIRIGSASQVTTDNPPGPPPIEGRSMLPDVGRPRRKSCPTVNRSQRRDSQSSSTVIPRMSSIDGPSSSPTPSEPPTLGPSSMSTSSDVKTLYTRPTPGSDDPPVTGGQNPAVSSDMDDGTHGGGGGGGGGCCCIIC